MALFIDKGLGSVLSMGATWLVSNRNNTQDQINNLQTSAAALRKLFNSEIIRRIRHVMTVDFLAGLSSLDERDRPVDELTEEEASDIQFPLRFSRKLDAEDGLEGTLHSRRERILPGTLYRIAQVLQSPSVLVAIAGLQRNEMSAAGQVQVFRAIRAMLDAAASVGLTQAQFQAVWQSLFGVSGGSGTSIWNPLNALALADPALDIAWTYGALVAYTSGFTAVPGITTAVAGGLVAGAEMAAGWPLFRFLNDGREQQSVRAARIQCKLIGAPVAGTLLTGYLPQSLIKQGAPKVSLQVEGATFASAGQPYVSGALGGSNPSFTVGIDAGGTAAQVFDLIIKIDA